jgi:glycosyltransferase involved in cell wall biosynthesis
MLVSIIVPVYNTEKFIAETLQSALNQTYQDIEIIVIDDASTDTSRAIIQDFQTQYPEKIRTIFHTKNTGESIGRREGFEASQWDYIYFLDADDRMYPDALERMLNGFQKTDAKVIVGHRDRIDENSQIIKNDNSARWGEMIIPHLDRIMMIHTPLTPGNLLISREIIFPSDFEASIRYGEDSILFVRLVHRSPFYCISGKPIYSYRVHPHQQTNGKVSFSERKKALSLIYKEPYLQKRYSQGELVILKSIAYTWCWLWCMTLRYPLIRKIYLLLSR